MGIVIKTGDITKEEACAIVNAANSSCMGGGGVDGAIHRAGGPQMLEECKRIRREALPDGLPTGQAVATTAGKMPARYVIHTVGPIWGRCGSEEECDRLLSDAYLNSLELAHKLDCRSIAFPAISTGIYGFPKERAARIAWQTVNEWLKTHPEMEVRFVFHSDRDREIFDRAVREEKP
ncbi:O-acetyl-ADP-ribose deacetylase [Nitratifractor salsuginis]|uniref:Appr-1-p processing domain protein n=1 Tax=Nitratifractor salsuginis (strain DSM 16511 / JCM 12458 / E9I37-1) TaxID=749222 RepID=E6X261_NITSE|nr:O-acetyl-ADP-ribose deacetylase [Nitratifractor salsuginis]ADV47130.1 Appr-1-p processing domain protein [Nitratifractor salsuginis DSM 16511]